MTQTWAWLARLTAIGMISAAAGIGARAQTPPASADPSRQDSAQTAVRDITGTWEGVFRLDSAWQLTRRATARSIPARIHFAAIGDATPATSSARSVHPGTFAIDFSRFGFVLSSREALGWSVAADSMRAMLNPTVDHGLVEVHGTVRGDSVVGTWRYVADPGGARGTFALRKSPTR